ncbi:MAG TPA: zincin-like metallopeptidase domain-containing protein, partial [Polyangiaceae bacterium]|nr:zincin-like metallopeptidase domain-containing protein [Polyangiaceae bacterium]
PNLYARITDCIVSALEQGVRPWVQPWSLKHSAGPVSRPLRHNGTPYTGINVLALWCTSVERGYVAPIWMTFRQALELGAHVRKGEKGALVVYANSFKVAEEDSKDDSGDEAQREVHYLKGYTVFNLEQIDGLPEQYTTQATPFQPSAEARIARAEHLAASTQATIRYGGGRAFYIPQADVVQMPPFEAFRDAESFYATLLHELTHWTAHPSRLARELGKRFGDTAYAAEELIAELGAAFLCADLGVTLEPREDHASYMATWLKVLRADQRAIFTAASHAQRAAQFLLDLASAHGA